MNRLDFPYLNLKTVVLLCCPQILGEENVSTEHMQPFIYLFI